MIILTYINGLYWDLTKISENEHIYAPLENAFLSNKLLVLPLCEGTIYFSDDIWDFSKYDVLHRSPGRLRYDFSGIHYSYVNVMKRQVLHNILVKNQAFSTIYSTFRHQLKVINYLISKRIFEPNLITLNIVKEYFKLLNKKTETSSSYIKRVFKELLVCIEKIHRNVDFKSIYEYLSKYNSAQLKIEKIAGMNADIPQEIHDKIISYAIQDINDPKLDKKRKKFACAILLLSQIGVRIGELRLLEANRDKESKVFDDDESLIYLELLTYKTIKDERYKWTKSFLTQVGLFAYKKLEELTAEDRIIAKSKYLFVSLHKKSKLKPMTETCLFQNFMRFYKRHGIILNNSKREYPNPHQYRVTLCTILYNKGYYLDWIREHMNHLTEQMTLHYIRIKEENEKQITFARDIITGIVQEDFRLIGHDAKKLKLKIEEFIEKNNYNIETDINAIVIMLHGLMPIREKAEGYCIRSAFGRTCGFEMPNGDLFCAFDMCPNHCVDYRVTDITYSRFLNKVQAIRYNEENEFIVDAQRETNKLKAMIKDYLLPEIDELKYEIQRQGIDKVKAEHNNLVEIIKEIDNIYLEVIKWIQ